MSPILQNTLTIFGGLILGSSVNIGLILLGGEIVPPPTGVDVTSMEELAKSMHLFELKHFLFPFLAHALGTLSGAAIAVKIATSHKLKIALFIGVLFLAGGITNVLILPSPMWFDILDLTVAYIPMGYIGYRIVIRNI